MNLDDALSSLEKAGNPKVREMYLAGGSPENTFGVKLGDLRGLAKKIKVDHQLGLELWKTGNAEARLLAILVLKPKALLREELTQMVLDADFAQLADWLNSYVVKLHPDKEALREEWMASNEKTASSKRLELDYGESHQVPSWD